MLTLKVSTSFRIRHIGFYRLIRKSYISDTSKVLSFGFSQINLENRLLNRIFALRNDKIFTVMSAMQANASTMFLDAMGPMISDTNTMNRVLAFIALLRHQMEPCQYTSDEMHDVIANSIANVKAGKVTTHTDLKKEIAQWL